jgi:hypothetical protein
MRRADPWSDDGFSGSFNRIRDSAAVCKWIAKLGINPPTDFMTCGHIPHQAYDSFGFF